MSTPARRVRILGGGVSISQSIEPELPRSTQPQLTYEVGERLPGDSQAPRRLRMVARGGGELIAVLDVDSHQPAAFDQEDRAGLELIASRLRAYLASGRAR